MRKLVLIVSLMLTAFTAVSLRADNEQEQMQIEAQLQGRIEGILAKTLPPNSYLVTVKAEMESRTRQSAQSTSGKKGGKNSLLGQNQYILPGVPGKKEFNTAPETSDETTVSAFSAETLVRRIMITILVAPDVTADQIRGLREVISGSIPFNPLRGDELAITNSTLLKPMSTPAAGASAPVSRAAEAKANGGLFSALAERSNMPVMVLSGALLMVFVFFLAFLFGPMRAFLNRLLAVLPRVGEQAAYQVSNAPGKNAAAQNGQNGQQGMNNNGNGNGQHNEEEEGARPFRFIREDQLAKLPILFKGLSPAQCALVLAYLPAEWASKVLGALDQAVQTAIMRELSQAREVPPEVVKEIEEFIKTKLPYLVGGTDWIQSVYHHTPASTQKALLGQLGQQSPELANDLRRKTFFLEDLGVISSGALRLLVQETGYPTFALALRDEKPDLRTILLNRLPVAMREILQQELELAADDKVAMQGGKISVMNVGRRLLGEGRITLPEKNNRG